MYLSTFSIIIPIFLGVLMYRTLTKPLLILFFYLCLTAIMEAWSSVLHTYGWSNLYLFKVHTLIEFVTFSSMYFLIIESRIFRKVCLLVVPLFTISTIFIETWRDSPDQLNTEVRVVESGILISYFIFHILHTYRKSNSPFLEIQPYFVLTIGLLIYFLGTMLVYLYYNYLEGETLMLVWALHSILNIVLNFIFAITIWKSRMV